ncbi:MAG: hypothetical protein V2A70_09780 [Candidatus Omnitrophota bacterium]
MIKKIVMLSAVGFMVLGSSAAFAQFGSLKGLAGAVAKPVAAANGVSTADLTTSKGAAVSTYLAASQALALSLEKAGEAFGVKKEVLEKLAVVQSLKEGNINDKDLEKARQSSAEAQAIIKEKMAATSAPSVEAKALMAESMIHLADGIQKETGLVPAVASLSSQAQAAVSSASPMEMLKVKDIAGTAVTLVTAIPKDLKLSKDILGMYMTYAKANNISTPSNATNLLKEE